MNPASSDPGQDEAFATLLARWVEGQLGMDKHEGIGLLWKEGGIGDFLAAFHRRAPKTMAAIAERLAEGAPEFRKDTTYIPRRLMSEFLAAMALPYKARMDHLAQLELFVSKRELHQIFEGIQPPMESRFRSRIESWLDLAAGIEARCNGTSAPVVAGQLAVGSKVVHAQWGSGVITALRPGSKPLATVDFSEHGVKKVLVSFLTAP